MNSKALIGRLGAVLLVAAVVGAGVYWYVSPGAKPAAQAMTPPPAEVGIVTLAPANNAGNICSTEASK